MTAVLSAMAAAVSGQSPIVAPEGTLRAAFIATNPAQAVRDPVSGELRGVAVDLARELARRQGSRPEMVAAANPQAVIDAVRDGNAEIGFVAYNPERAGPVEFSRPYLLVQQTFLVREASSIRSIGDVDKPGNRVAATKGDSIALHLGRTLKQAQLVELTDATPARVNRMLLANAIDAFGANRQRLSDAVKTSTGLRVLPDDLYGVEQTLIVSKANAAALPALNAFIEDVLRSGFLRDAIARSGVVGVSPAPP